VTGNCVSHVWLDYARDVLGDQVEVTPVDSDPTLFPIKQQSYFPSAVNILDIPEQNFPHVRVIPKRKPYSDPSNNLDTVGVPKATDKKELPRKKPKTSSKTQH